MFFAVFPFFPFFPGPESRLTEVLRQWKIAIRTDRPETVDEWSWWPRMRSDQWQRANIVTSRKCVLIVFICCLLCSSLVSLDLFWLFLSCQIAVSCFFFKCDREDSLKVEGPTIHWGSRRSVGCHAGRNARSTGPPVHRSTNSTGDVTSSRAATLFPFFSEEKLQADEKKLSCEAGKVSSLFSNVA